MDIGNEDLEDFEQKRWYNERMRGCGIGIENGNGNGNGEKMRQTKKV